jgi:hypothetical protein
VVRGGPKQKQGQQKNRDRSQRASGAEKFHRTILNVRDQRVSSKK